MTSVKDIYNFIDKIAPFNTQAEWDNSGLLVGDMQREINKVLVSLDITDEVVKEAKEKGCELLLSHHPVIFSPLSSIKQDSIVYSLIKEDISALCAHTNLDKADKIGVNAALADALDLKDTTLYPDSFLCIGNLNKTLSCDEFAEYVKTALNCNGVRYTKSGDINKVGVSSGGGGDAVELARIYGFDALVTGELKHHQFLYAKEHNICAVEAGHFNTEDVVINPLISALKSEFSCISFLKSDTLTDPVSFA